MLFTGCQGKKDGRLQEKICPNCGGTVEILSPEISAGCTSCGFTVFSDLMDCAYRCPSARECVGAERYEKLMAAKAAWQARQQEEDGDEW